MALAVQNDWEIDHIDVVAAYLAAPIDKKIFMEIPAGYDNQGNETQDCVCELKKCIYRLPQSGREWNKRINIFLLKMGFTRSKVDPCVYYDNSKKTIVTLYVDDNLIYRK